MKRGGFLKRTPLARKSKRKTTIITVQIPSWVSGIPQSNAHGSTVLQKRLWRLVSDYTRIRDWYLYNGKCVATGEKISSWKYGNAGHFISYSVCNGLFKFDERNIHLQSAKSNAWGGQSIGFSFGEELAKRYGLDYVKELHRINNEHINEKCTDDVVMIEINRILDLMSDLKVKPDYYDKVNTKRVAVSS